MSGYVLRRLALALVTLVAALTGLLALLHASPGSPVNALPPAVAADPGARAAFLADRGLDRPFVVQWARYLGHAARGDLGTSLYDGSSVAGAVAGSVSVSIELGGLAALVAVVGGGAVGVAAARRPGGVVDGVVRVGSLLAISTPSYWLAVLALVVVGERAPDLVPGAGGLPTWSEDPLRHLQALLLPALVLGLGGFAMVARSVRQTFGEVLDGPQVRFARAAGLSEGQVLRRVALRGAAPATITLVGLLVAGLVSGTVLIENVFQLPGLGQLAVTAIGRDDYPLALGCALATAVLLLATNVAVDLAVLAFDPRARRRAVGGGR